MVIHDTECPYWDQVSLSNRKLIQTSQGKVREFQFWWGKLENLAKKAGKCGCDYDFVWITNYSRNTVVKCATSAAVRVQRAHIQICIFWSGKNHQKEKEVREFCFFELMGSLKVILLYLLTSYGIEWTSLQWVRRYTPKQGLVASLDQPASIHVPASVDVGCECNKTRNSL